MTNRVSSLSLLLVAAIGLVTIGANSAGAAITDNLLAYWPLESDYLDASGAAPRVMTIYAWNEWTEGGYLEPEQRTGMSYLEALREVLSPATVPASRVRRS